MKGFGREPFAPLALLVVALVLAWMPHASRFPLWFSGALLALAGTRLLLARLGLPLPPRWALLPATAVATVGAIIGFRPFFGGNGAIALLSAMTVLKLYELHSRRDRIVCALLGYVLAATRFTYGQTPLAALWMLGLTVLFSYILAESADEESEMGVSEKIRLVARLLLLATPVALVLFLVFPRAGAPLFALSGSRGGVTGLSEEMKPGSLSNLVLSEEIVFRARLMDAFRAELYWRGPVLEDFDGQTWRVAKAVGGPPPESTGVTASQLIVVQPGVKWLTPLDYPSSVGEGLGISGDGVVKIASSRFTTTYEATSFLKPSFKGLSAERRAALTYVPGGSGGRVGALAEQFASGAASDAVVAQRILAWFGRENFIYTLRPPLLGEDPVGEFLFETRRGFCEHFASAMAVLLRRAGVPARIVTGYLGGEYNPFGGHWIVQELHSHAWVEAWIEGSGWTRLDPTATVSPDRVHSVIDPTASLASDFVRFGFGRGGLFVDARLAMDFLGFWWEEYLVGFGQEKQRRLLESLGLGGGAGFAALVGATIGAPLLFVLLLGALNGRRANRDLDPAERLWSAFLRKLEKRGIVKEPHEPPRAFAGRAGKLLPERSDEIAALTALYERSRYGPPQDSPVAELKNAVASFKIGKSKTASRTVEGAEK